jgi:hypothetical protein
MGHRNGGLGRPERGPDPDRTMISNLRGGLLPAAAGPRTYRTATLNPAPGMA